MSRIVALAAIALGCAAAETAPLAAPTPGPLASPTPRPRSSSSPQPLPTAGDPRLFRVPDVRIDSPSRVTVFIERAGSTPLPGVASTAPSPAIPLPSFAAPDGSSAMDVVVRDASGAVVATGKPAQPIERGGGDAADESQDFSFDPPIPQSDGLYSVEGRWRASGIAGNAAYLNSVVPSDVGSRVGDRFIEADRAGALPSTVFYVEKIEDANGHRTWYLRTHGKHPVRWYVHDYESDPQIGPMVSTPEIEALRRTYAGKPATTGDALFGCFNELGEGAEVYLRAGRSVQIDTIARAAHARRRLDDEPLALSMYDFPCAISCADRRSTFVESPLVVGFSVAPEDVVVVPPLLILGFQTFQGGCTRGFTVVRDAAAVCASFALR